MKVELSMRALTNSYSIYHNIHCTHIGILRIV